MVSILAAIMVASLVLYVLLAGADFGAGFWDLLSRGPLKQEQRNLIANAIQPIWEANHVWLILLLVLLFSGFPPAFGTIMVALHVPILLMLAGIVLRGSAFIFRAYSTEKSGAQRACAFIFSISSCLTPFFAGIVLASLSDDQVLVSHDASVNGYLLNWLNPFTIAVGVLTLALFSFLAAAYLTVEASFVELQLSFRIRALASGVAVAILLVVVYLLSGHYARGFREGLAHNWIARSCEFLAGVALALAFVALYKSRFRVARVMAALYAGLIVIGWAVAQYPYIARPERTIFNSVVSETVIRDIVLAVVAGAVVLFPSLGMLLYVFKHQGKHRAAASSTHARS